MEKLELKHIAPYLPYGLEIRVSKPVEHIYHIGNYIDKGESGKLTSLSNDRIILQGFYYTEIGQVKPILRPLSDLTNINERHIHNYESFDLQKREELQLAHLFHKTMKLEDVKYLVFIKLLENHYDVFGLIEKGLAIDINTLEQKGIINNTNNNT